MDGTLERIRRAYDLTVTQHDLGIDPLSSVPEDLRTSPGFAEFLRDTARWCNSGAPENREFLHPEPGMRFLDVGCAASLVNYGLALWPSTYYGVDVSPRLIEAMRSFVVGSRLEIGGLYVAELAELPFESAFFDIAGVVGVLEYWDSDYVDRALAELQRVLKPGARAIVDIPNPEHRHFESMFLVEERLGRPICRHSTTVFERLLTSRFSIVTTDDAHVMVKYFITA
jgi:SAM-dependent methyltransferase